MIKPCPGTREYICCGYRILNTATNCPIDCTYCILQAYFNQPYLRLFANLEDIFTQLGIYAREREGEIIRLGTGEFTDSLVFDPITRFSPCWPRNRAYCPIGGGTENQIRSGPKPVADGQDRTN